MPHYPGHLILGVAALAVTLGVMTLSVNQMVRRKLRLSVFLLGAYVLFNIVVALRPELLPGAEATWRGFERLTLATALINLGVFGLINPLRVDRVPERFPTILQDTILIVLVMAAATLLNEQLLTTSAVSAVVIGFALQDTLGNAFAGLAIQSEKPFQVGDWIRVAAFEGRVAEVTWRAVKLRTRTGNFVILPNNTVGKDAIINYSRPAQPARLEVDVGVTYDASPTRVKAAILEAIGHVPRVRKSPAPDVVLRAFDGSSIGYRARFWVDEYEFDEEAGDEVRTAIFHALRRHDIEIPYPTQVEYSRAFHEVDVEARVAEQERLLSSVDLFEGLPPELRQELARSTSTRIYGDGEMIVRQGSPGDSMFVIAEGTVAILLEPDRREIARNTAGGYFGEMSLLTGDPRSATVVARGDVRVIELDADMFRRLGAARPEAVEQMAAAAVHRRAEIDRHRSAAAGAATVESSSLMARIRKFLRLTR